MEKQRHRNRRIGEGASVIYSNAVNGRATGFGSDKLYTNAVDGKGKTLKGAKRYDKFTDEENAAAQYPRSKLAARVHRHAKVI